MIYAVNKHILSEHRLLDATEGRLYVRQPQAAISFTDSFSRLFTLLGQLLFLSFVIYAAIIFGHFVFAWTSSKIKAWHAKRALKLPYMSTSSKASQPLYHAGEQFIYDIEKAIGTPDLSYSPSSTSSLNEMAFSPPQLQHPSIVQQNVPLSFSSSFMKGLNSQSGLDILKGGASDEAYVKIR